MPRMNSPLRRRPLLTGFLGLVLAGGGCSSMNHTDRGVVTGGVLGALGGAAIGSVAGRPGAGAALGAGLGAVAGGASGAAIDNSERRMDARLAAARAPVLGLRDVVDLTASGSSDDVIITQIRQTGSVYRLTAQDIVYLQNSGVREPVIREMQTSCHRPVRHVYTAVPVAPVAPVYVVHPVPPPPVGVGVGVTFRGR